MESIKQTLRSKEFIEGQPIVFDEGLLPYVDLYENGGGFGIGHSSFDSNDLERACILYYILHIEGRICY